MKKILVILGILVIIGTGVGYSMYSSSASTEIPADRYGEFKVVEADHRELTDYIIRYDKFSEYMFTLGLTYGLMSMSDDKAKQYDLASDYVELYIAIRDLMYLTNKNYEIPSEFESLHKSMIKEIGIADLISEEFGDAIDSGDFSKIDELTELSKETRKEGLASTDRIQYFEEANQFIMKD